MGKYCGDSVPSSHISSSNEIMVHFETYYNNGNNDGFKLMYNPISNYRINLINYRLIILFIISSMIIEDSIVDQGKDLDFHLELYHLFYSAALDDCTLKES